MQIGQEGLGNFVWLFSLLEMENQSLQHRLFVLDNYATLFIFSTIPFTFFLIECAIPNLQELPKLC